MREAFACLLLLWMTLAMVWPDWAGKEFGEKSGKFLRAFDAAYAAYR
jgi:hypothetical protein